MSEIKVKYALSDEYRKRVFAETGNLPPAQDSLTFDATTLTPAQRAAIVAYAGTQTTFDLVREFRTEWRDGKIVVFPDYGLRLYVFDQALAPALIVSACTEMLNAQEAERAKFAAKLREKMSETISRSIAALREMIENHDPKLAYSAGLSDVELEQIKFCALDLTERNTLKAQWESLKPQFEREATERAEAKKLADEQAKAAKAEADAKAHAEKVAWVNEHGSDQLRRGLEAGHTCSRLYAIERAALEYPTCVLDYENNAEWKERACPSINALDTRDALIAKHSDAKVSIVWLTDEPLEHKRGEDDWDEPFEECEAIVVNDPNFGQYLYKLL